MNSTNTIKENKEVQVDKDDNAEIYIRNQTIRDKHISVFVKTTQELQDVIKDYEIQVNKTTNNLKNLHNKIELMKLQLSHKNKMIGSICDRYVALCKEKQTSENNLQHKLDGLTEALEACKSKNNDHVKKLLIQQINRNRHLEYENECLNQLIAKLCQQK